MSNQEFMQELKKRLKRLPFDEQREAVEYYEGYLADGGEISETPSEVAMKIVSEFAENSEKSNGFTKTWVVLLTIFASPIALPILAAIGAVAFAIVVSAGSIIVSLWATGFALFVAGIATVFCACAIIGQSIATMVFFLGLGLIMIALGFFLSIATIKLSKKSFDGIAKLFNKLLTRRVAR